MKPRSPLDQTSGMSWFPRMLDKIRLQARGELDVEYLDNLGKGMDGRCADFLRVNYEALRARTLEGGADEDVLAWCFETGRPLDKGDLFVWNAFVAKLGWNDPASGRLAKFKEAASLGARDDIQTIAHLIDVEEGRQP